MVGIWERWGAHRARVGSGPVSPSPFPCHPALPGWELLSPGQSDLIWHLLCFLQEQGSQPAALNQGIVSFLCRNRTYGGKENFKNKTLFKNVLPLPKPSHLMADSWADTSVTNSIFWLFVLQIDFQALPLLNYHILFHFLFQFSQGFTDTCSVGLVFISSCWPPLQFHAQITHTEIIS